MLATVPLITNGIASYFLVPLSIAVGRRPILLLTAVLAWSGGLWAGLSTSLQSHLAARAMMGLGAGAVEALIPLVVQDMVFIHQRAKAQSTIVASQVRGFPTDLPLGLEMETIRSSTDNSLGCDHYWSRNCCALHFSQLRLAIPLLRDLCCRHRCMANAHCSASRDSLDPVERSAR